MSQVLSTKHKSPAKRIRDIKRLLSFLLVKCKQQPSADFSPLPEHDDESAQPQLAAKPFTLNDFHSLTRSIRQDTEEQQRHEEQIRHEERKKDLRTLQIFLGLHAT